MNFLKLFQRNSGEVFQSHRASRILQYKDVRFKTDPGGLKEMAVDGSITPVEFAIGPPAGEVWSVDYATLAMIDPGDMNPTVFASLGAALTNGLELYSLINSVERQITNLSDNLDLAQCFFGGQPTGQATAGSDPGFLNEIDRALGRMNFSHSITLIGDDGDMLGFRVRDDLTGVTNLRASIHAKFDIEGGAG